MNSVSAVLNIPNKAPSSNWMLVKKMLIAVTIFSAVIAVSVTGSKLFDYAASYGHYNQRTKLYDLIQWGLVTLFIFWAVNKSLLMGSVDKIAKKMRLPKFFEPKDSDQTTQVARGSYLGIDFETGVIGVVSAYATGHINQKVTYFESDLIESYDYDKDHLILNLRCTRVPSMHIPVKDGQLMFRKVEQLARLCTVHDTRRTVEPYLLAKSELLADGKMLKPDY